MPEIEPETGAECELAERRRPVSSPVQWFVLVLVSLVRLWLTDARAVTALGWAAHDDAWFIRTAHHLLDGRWLGPYSEMTLIKGVGYPLWIAFVSSLRIPLLLAQQLLYVLACFAVYFAVAPVIRNPWARLGLFVALLFNPMSFSDGPATRITREAIYPALTLFVLTALAAMVLRLEGRHRIPITLSALGGVALAFFWHTREEGVWILPMIGAVFVAVLLWLNRERPTRWKPALLVLALPLLILAVAHGALVLANGLTYGVYIDVDLKEKAFRQAYGSLTSVRRRDLTPRVPVPKEVRERAYAVSPAFAELRPFLEGHLGAGWRESSEVKGDIGGGWFPWALREAAASAGYYKRGARAVEQYYQRISAEIETARRQRRIDAAPARASMLPPLLRGQKTDVLRTWLRGMWRLPFFDPFSAQPTYSTGSEAELAEFREVTRSRLAPPESIALMEIVGWVLHVDGALEMRVEDARRRPVPGARIRRLPSEDVYQHLKKRWKDFPPARHARFELSVPRGDTVLVLARNGVEVERIQLGFEVPVSLHPDVRMSVDKISFQTVKPPVPSRDRFRLDVLQGIGRAYQLVFPLVVVIAVLLYLSNVRRLARWGTGWTVPLLVIGLWGSIAARTMILALIDVTSFSAIGSYQCPSHALLIVVTVLMVHDGIIAIRERTSQRRVSREPAV